MSTNISFSNIEISDGRSKGVWRETDAKEVHFNEGSANQHQGSRDLARSYRCLRQQLEKNPEQLKTFKQVERALSLVESKHKNYLKQNHGWWNQRKANKEYSKLRQKLNNETPNVILRQSQKAVTEVGNATLQLSLDMETRQVQEPLSPGENNVKISIPTGETQQKVVEWMKNGEHELSKGLTSINKDAAKTLKTNRNRMIVLNWKMQSLNQPLTKSQRQQFQSLQDAMSRRISHLDTALQVSSLGELRLHQDPIAEKHSVGRLACLEDPTQLPNKTFSDDSFYSYQLLGNPNQGLSWSAYRNIAEELTTIEHFSSSETPTSELSLMLEDIQGKSPKTQESCQQYIDTLILLGLPEALEEELKELKHSIENTSESTSLFYGMQQRQGELKQSIQELKERRHELRKNKVWSKAEKCNPNKLETGNPVLNQALRNHMTGLYMAMEERQQALQAPSIPRETLGELVTKSQNSSSSPKIQESLLTIAKELETHLSKSSTFEEVQEARTQLQAQYRQYKSTHRNPFSPGQNGVRKAFQDLDQMLKKAETPVTIRETKELIESLHSTATQITYARTNGTPSDANTGQLASGFERLETLKTQLNRVKGRSSKEKLQIHTLKKATELHSSQANTVLKKHHESHFPLLRKTATTEEQETYSIARYASLHNPTLLRRQVLSSRSATLYKHAQKRDLSEAELNEIRQGLHTIHKYEPNLQSAAMLVDGALEVRLTGDKRITKEAAIDNLIQTGLIDVFVHSMEDMRQKVSKMDKKSELYPGMKKQVAELEESVKELKARRRELRKDKAWKKGEHSAPLPSNSESPLMAEALSNHMMLAYKAVKSA